MNLLKKSLLNGDVKLTFIYDLDESTLIIQGTYTGKMPNDGSLGVYVTPASGIGGFEPLLDINFIEKSSFIYDLKVSLGDRIGVYLDKKLNTPKGNIGVDIYQEKILISSEG